MKSINALAFHAALAALLWYGFYEGYAGPANVFRFTTWFLLLPASVVALNAATGKRSPIGGAGPVAAFICRWARIAMFGALIWAGVWFTGLAFGASILLLAAARQEEKKLAA